MPDIISLVEEIRECVGINSEERRELILKNFITKFDVTGEERSTLFKTLLGTARIGLSSKTLQKCFNDQFNAGNLSDESLVFCEEAFFGHYIQEKEVAKKGEILNIDPFDSELRTEALPF